MLSVAQVLLTKKIINSDDQEMTSAFNALSDKGRFKIFKLLLHKSDLCVTDIANILGVSVPAASQQLKIIELSGLIKKNRVGQMICYSVRHENRLARSLIQVINNNT